jgi:V/A-type H+/Na+-transporting ATPase subunit E
MAAPNTVKTAGVEDLIDRLKTDGVSKGQQEAEALVADAKRQAMAILDAARQEADEIVTSAKSEAERVRLAGEQALQLAGRDALLKLRESFQMQFENRLRKLVGKTLENPELLKQMILEVAGKSRPQSSSEKPGSSEKMELLLPAAAAGHDPLSAYVAGLTGDMLREGVTFGVGEDIDTGARVRLVDRDVEVDLSDQALAGFLARFLVPRFRQIMDF